MEQVCALLERWASQENFHIDKLLSRPELAMVKAVNDYQFPNSNIAISGRLGQTL